MTFRAIIYCGLMGVALATVLYFVLKGRTTQPEPLDESENFYTEEIKTLR